MVVSLLSALAIFSTPFYISFLRRNDLSNAARAVSLAMQNAEVHSQGILLDQTWSVHVAQGAVTVYLGTNYASRDSVWDITTTLNPTISVAGPQDISFSRGTGLPSAAQSITLTNLSKETRTITLNAKGLVDIQ
jgi:Tfp pilus assembly protein FimT